MEALRLVSCPPCDASGFVPAVEAVCGWVVLPCRHPSLSNRVVKGFWPLPVFGRCEQNQALYYKESLILWSLCEWGGLPLCWWEQKPPPPFSIWVLFPQFFWVLSGGFPTLTPYWALSSKLKGGSAYSPEHSLCVALSSPSCALLTLATFGLPSIQLHLLGPAPLPGCSLQVVTWGSPGAHLVSSCLSGVTVLLYLTCSVSNTIASPTLSRLLVISDGGYTQPLSIHCGVRGSFQPRTATL